MEPVYSIPFGNFKQKIKITLAKDVIVNYDTLNKNINNTNLKETKIFSIYLREKEYINFLKTVNSIRPDENKLESYLTNYKLNQYYQKMFRVKIKLSNDIIQFIYQNLNNSSFITLVAPIGCTYYQYKKSGFFIIEITNLKKTKLTYEDIDYSCLKLIDDPVKYIPSISQIKEQYYDVSNTTNKIHKKIEKLEI